MLTYTISHPMSYLSIGKDHTKNCSKETFFWQQRRRSPATSPNHLTDQRECYIEQIRVEPIGFFEEHLGHAGVTKRPNGISSDALGHCPQSMQTLHTVELACPKIIRHLIVPSLLNRNKTNIPALAMPTSNIFPHVSTVVVAG